MKTRGKKIKRKVSRNTVEMYYKEQTCLWTTAATDKTPTTISILKVYYSRILGQNGKQAVIMETPAGKSGLGINDWTTAAIPFPMETLKLTCAAIVWVGRDLKEHLVPTCPLP